MLYQLWSFSLSFSFRKATNTVQITPLTQLDWLLINYETVWFTNRRREGWKWFFQLAASKAASEIDTLAFVYNGIRGRIAGGGLYRFYQITVFLR